jgi:glycosyltransferase involved in cell wall biosynthesis
MSKRNGRPNPSVGTAADPLVTLPPFVSVVIPVYDDAARLRRCLQALAAQTYPRDRFEVIVVDNGSSDDVGAAVAGLPFVVLAAEARRGSYAARNAGVALSRGTILAFTDSDCVPEPGWLAAGAARLVANPGCGLVAGRIELFFAGPSPTAVELYERITAFPQHEYVERDHYGATANMLTWRTVMERIGPFAAQLASGGDREWGQRVHAAGLPLIYADEVRVGHPARRTFGELARKVARVTGGIEALRARSRDSRGPFVRAVIKDLLPPAGKIRRIWADRSLGGAASRLGVVGVLIGLRYTRALARIQARLGALVWREGREGVRSVRA